MFASFLQLVVHHTPHTTHCHTPRLDPLPANCSRLRTRFIEGTHNPVWNERFEINVADDAEELVFSVKVRGA